jgi:hypothetical protein
MRAILTIILLAAAFWRAALDWTSTIGAGYAYRFDTVGGIIAGRWPDNYAQLVESLQRSGVPFAWSPVGAFVMSIPVALLLAALAATVWITRGSARTR